MTTDNIFSGLKVVDLASFIAGPGAAVILSDFGADVIKVEPPTGDTWRIGYKVPPQPRAMDNYPWHLNNRNKRGLALDLKSAQAPEILQRLVKWADVLIVNTPHPARKRLKLTYEDVAQWNPRLIYADLTGYGEKGPDADLPGFDITAYWARSGLLSLTRDAGAPPTLPVSGSGDHGTAISLFSDTRRVETALALVMGNSGEAVPLLRIHSQCFTGEVLGSLRCDCRTSWQWPCRPLPTKAAGLSSMNIRRAGALG